MGCFGSRDQGPTKQSQKWDYITLSDFKATSAWNSLAYIWLWLLFLSTIVIYAVDTWTAVTLLVFDKWSSQVQPKIPFAYSKWIFAGCIIFSWVLWGFEWIRAIRVIRRGGVAESYMDPLAVSLQSMRSQGWRRFLVFAELTKSKKGMDMVAFFSYFAFKGAIRIIVAEGPRQVINLLTLIAVIQADFTGPNQPANESGISLFWYNLQKMYNADHLQAIIIFGMIYSLLIWALSIICLATAATLYVVFLWHYIPSTDNGLSNFCRRKVDKRLEKIVEAKVKAAIAEEEAKKKKAEEKAWKKAGMKGKPSDAVSIASTAYNPGYSRQPTLPQLGDHDVEKGEVDSFIGEPLRRQDTMNSVSTLPAYASRPGTRNENRPPLPMYNSERPPPVRSATMGSAWTTTSYESDAPLLANAGPAGEMPSRPGTAFTRQDSNASFARPPMLRGPDSARPYSPAPSLPRGPDSARPYSPAPSMFRGPDSARPYSPAPGMPRGPDSARPYSPAPTLPRMMTNPEGERDFSPMNRMDFSQTGTAPAPSGTPAPRMGPQRSESPFRAGRSGSPNQRPGSRAESPYNRSESRSAMRNNTPAPIRLDNQTPDQFQQPQRQPTLPHVSTPSGSFSRPIPPQRSTPTGTSFSRPYAPTNADVSTPPADSYEMQSNPWISDKPSSPGNYVAFNPTRTASPAPMAPPQRSMTGTSDYFSHKNTADAPSRSMTAPPPPQNQRDTTGYSDIVADYGHERAPAPSSGGPRTPAGGWNNPF